MAADESLNVSMFDNSKVMQSMRIVISVMIHSFQFKHGFSWH